MSRTIIDWQGALPSADSDSGHSQESVSQTTAVSAIFVVLFLVVLLRTAWVGDDPFITMRTVDNFVSGYGLTWNIGERVQAFTHPLWLMLLSGVYLITSEATYTLIVVSVGISVLAIAILLRGICRSPHQVVLAAVTLILSSSFVEYSTSGLENPLSYLLLVCFLYLFLRRQPGSGSAVAITVLGGLICLNRMDLVVIVCPVLAYTLWPYRWKRGLKILLLGTLPFTAWLVFSIVYFGYPFPNTYYAKLYTGISLTASVMQGLYYLLDSITFDPITLSVIASAVLISIVGKRPKHLAVALGVVLYLIYVVKIGGDFMSGRFLSVPLLASVALLVSQRLTFTLLGRIWPIIFAAILGLVGPRCPILTDHTYGIGPGEGAIRSNGICDERGFYFQRNGLVNSQVNTLEPPYSWGKAREEALKEKDSVVVKGAIGFFGYAAGRSKYIIDPMALTDPLLSHLPIPFKDTWRIGHFARELPPGYTLSRKSGQNRVFHMSLSAVFDDILKITRGPIFSADRFSAIFRMNLYLNDSLLYDYSRSPSYLEYDEISSPRRRGTAWNAEGTILVKKIGVDIGLKSIRHDTLLEISVDHNDDYLLLFREDASVLCSILVARNLIIESGLRVDTLRIPSPCAQLGYNTIHLKAVSGDRRYSFGHLRFLDLQRPTRLNTK